MNVTLREYLELLGRKPGSRVVVCALGHTGVACPAGPGAGCQARASGAGSQLGSNSRLSPSQLLGSQKEGFTPAPPGA